MKQIDLDPIWIDTDNLEPNDWNINELSNMKFEALKKSIQKRGFLEAIIVRKYGDKWQILNGFHRWKACIELEIDTMPCIIYDCNDIEAQTLTIGANEFRGETNLAKFSGWLDSQKDETIDKLADELGLKKSILYRYASYDFTRTIKFDPHKESEKLAPLLLLVTMEKYRVIMEFLFETVQGYQEFSTLETKEIFGNFIYRMVMDVKDELPEDDDLLTTRYMDAQDQGVKRALTLRKKYGAYASCTICHKSFSAIGVKLHITIKHPKEKLEILAMKG